jgi:hypothetical protein
VLAGEVERLKADIAEYEQRIENTAARGRADHLESSTKHQRVDPHAAAEAGRRGDRKTIETNNKGERFRVVESAEIPTRRSARTARSGSPRARCSA